MEKLNDAVNKTGKRNAVLGGRSSQLEWWSKKQNMMSVIGVVVVVGMFVCSGCWLGEKNYPNTPEGVVTRCLDCFQEGNIQKFRECFSGVEDAYAGAKTESERRDIAIEIGEALDNFRNTMNNGLRGRLPFKIIKSKTVQKEDPLTAIVLYLWMLDGKEENAVIGGMIAWRPRNEWVIKCWLKDRKIDGVRQKYGL